jgi:glyoxylase-like metal-dependent hydrolase (beta-lactamase superfamily II)
VLLTHLHADHVGGIAPSGISAFPNAVIRSSKLDADYWLNDTNEKAAPDFLRPMVRRRQGVPETLHRRRPLYILRR